MSDKGKIVLLHYSLFPSEYWRLNEKNKCNEGASMTSRKIRRKKLLLVSEMNERIGSKVIITSDTVLLFDSPCPTPIFILYQLLTMIPTLDDWDELTLWSPSRYSATVTRSTAHRIPSSSETERPEVTSQQLRITLVQVWLLSSEIYRTCLEM